MLAISDGINPRPLRLGRSILYAREVPDFGGDTLFANMYLAYDALSDGMKRMLDGLTAVHSARRPYGPRSDWFPTQRARDIRRSNSEHPVIRTHPKPGARGCLSTKHVLSESRPRAVAVHSGQIS